MERETFQSRLGFLLLSAGCAIGIGNVWRFPYITGKYGGGVFVLLYIFFLVLVGVPVMTMEFAIGRASQKSTVRAYHVLEKPGQKWHVHGYIALAGNFVLMMFYTSVAGWMIHYFYRYVTGSMEGIQGDATAAAFGEMLASPGTVTIWMILIVAAGFFICSRGLQKGVESVSKWMMVSLLILMLVLAVHSFTLEGGGEGLKFYLMPDFQRTLDSGLFETVTAAMNQAFFTLSLGIGAMADLRQLHRQRATPCWVSPSALPAWTPSWHSYRRPHHFPGLLCLRRQPGQRPVPSSLSPCPTFSIPWPAAGSGAACSSCLCFLHPSPRSSPCLRTLWRVQEICSILEEEKRP